MIGRRIVVGRRSGLPAVLFAIVLGLFVLGPLARLLLRAGANGGEGFTAFAGYPQIGSIVFNTIALAAGSVVIAVVLGVLLAWCSSRLPLGWRKTVGNLPLLTLVLPMVSVTMGWVYLLSPRAGYVNVVLRKLPFWRDSITGPLDGFTMLWITILTGLSLTSFVFLFVREALDKVGEELLGVASVAGASNLRAFFSIALPIIRPSIVYSGGLVGLIALGQFNNPLILGRDKNINVLTTVLYIATNNIPVKYGLGAAISVPLVLFGIVVMIMQRRTIGDERKYAVETGRSVYRSTHGSPLYSLPLFLYCFCSFVLPLTALLIVAFSKYWSISLSSSNFTVANFGALIHTPEIAQAIRTSIVSTLIAVVIVVPLGLCVSLIIAHPRPERKWLSRVFDVTATVPLAMPAALTAFAILFTYALRPFNLYGTLAIIVIAYVLLMIPYAVRPQLSVALNVGREFQEASSVLGASKFRTFRSVSLPLLKPGTTAATVLVFILLFQDFAASLMVSAFGHQTIGVALYTQYVKGAYPVVAALSLIMAFVTAVAVSITLIVGRRRAHG